MAQVGGIFIGHEHSDHIAGLQQLLKRFDIPVYTKQGTWREIQDKLVSTKESINRTDQREFAVWGISL